MNKHANFYDNIDRERIYSTIDQPVNHRYYKELIGFIKEYNLADKKCLEIGSSKGIFQNIVTDYTGLDIAPSLSKYYQKPYVVVNCDGTYPLKDAEFDAIWSIAVHEHIPNLTQALLELKRILKRGGVVYFKPAWQCNSWAAEGYPVRPYSDLGLKGKLIKASIPIRQSVFWRSLFIFPKRIFRHCRFLLGRRFNHILYKKLVANYDYFWISDSDACNSIDPHDAILWFESNGFTCLSNPLHIKAFLVRTGGLIFKKSV